MTLKEIRAAAATLGDAEKKKLYVNPAINMTALNVLSLVLLASCGGGGTQSESQVVEFPEYGTVTRIVPPESEPRIDTEPSLDDYRAAWECARNEDSDWYNRMIRASHAEFQRIANVFIPHWNQELSAGNIPLQVSILEKDPWQPSQGVFHLVITNTDTGEVAPFLTYEPIDPNTGSIQRLWLNRILPDQKALELALVDISVLPKYGNRFIYTVTDVNTGKYYTVYYFDHQTMAWQVLPPEQMPSN